MNQQEVKPTRWDPLEPIRRALIPFLSPSETIRVIAIFSNLPQWTGCVFTSLFLVWFKRTWYVATTEQNVYVAKWGFGKIDSKSVLRIPRKDVQLEGNDLIFMILNESKPRKLYSVLLGGDTRFKEDLLNPGNFTVNQSGSLIQEVAGVPQPVSQPDQTSQKTCPKCAEKIQLEALVCRFCGHQFDESEVQAMKQQIDEQKRESQRLANERAQEARQLVDEEAALRKVESKKKSRITWGWILAIVGGMLFVVGFCLGSLAVIGRTSGTGEQDIEGFMIGLSCISFTPVIIGLGLLGLGTYTLRKKSNVEESPTQSVPK